MGPLRTARFASAFGLISLALLSATTSRSPAQEPVPSALPSVEAVRLGAP